MAAAVAGSAALLTTAAAAAVIARHLRQVQRPSPQSYGLMIPTRVLTCGGVSIPPHTVARHRDNSCGLLLSARSRHVNSGNHIRHIAPSNCSLSLPVIQADAAVSLPVIQADAAVSLPVIQADAAVPLPAIHPHTVARRWPLAPFAVISADSHLSGRRFGHGVPFRDAARRAEIFSRHFLHQLRRGMHTADESWWWYPYRSKHRYRYPPSRVAAHPASTQSVWRTIGWPSAIAMRSHFEKLMFDRCPPAAERRTSRGSFWWQSRITAPPSGCGDNQTCGGSTGCTPCGRCTSCVSLESVVKHTLDRQHQQRQKVITANEQDTPPPDTGSTTGNTKFQKALRRRVEGLNWHLKGSGSDSRATVGSGVGIDTGGHQGGSVARDSRSRVSIRRRRLLAKWTKLLRASQGLGKWSMGNRVTVFDSNTDCFQDMWNAIDSASDRVWLETYVFDNSHAAEVTAGKLSSASERGCDVVVLADYIGSFSMRTKLVKEMEGAGVRVIFFNRALPFYDKHRAIGPATFRDHRKILVADGIGHCGSVNISGDDADPPYGSGKYYDMQLRVEGPAVAHLAAVFVDSLSEATKSRDCRPLPPHAAPYPDGVYVQILESNVRRQIRSIQNVMEHVIRTASESVVITQSYFIPPGFLKKAFRSVALKGVRISALLSGASDVPGDYRATLYILAKLLRPPVHHDTTRVFFMKSRHCHAKCTVVDGLWSSIGSFNWDRYSSRRNLEVVATVFDADVASKLQALHEKKTAVPHESREFLRSEWESLSIFRRWTCRAAYWLAKLSGQRFFDGFDDVRNATIFHKRSHSARARKKS